MGAKYVKQFIEEENTLTALGEDNHLAGLNGYIVIKDVTYGNLSERAEAEVDVHGGVTYCGIYKDGVIFGFDTGHYNSNEYPRFSKMWIKKEIKKMLDGILALNESE